jgi:hypothetical protein
MLIDHGVGRTGKEGAANKALTGGAELCGPDGHAMKAKMMQDYRDCEKIERRKTRGGATFRPGDAC